MVSDGYYLIYGQSPVYVKDGEKYRVNLDGSIGEHYEGGVYPSCETFFPSTKEACIQWEEYWANRPEPEQRKIASQKEPNMNLAEKPVEKNTG
jgi:hypothetical protein